MKKNTLMLRILFIFLSSLVISANAQTIKVQKVKDNQAVIEFEGTTLRVGRSYELMTENNVRPTSFSSARDYLLSLSVNITNSKSDSLAAQSLTSLAMSGTWGWNFSNFEVGPAASYSSSEVAGISTKIMKFGAFTDYNLVPNVPGETFTYGLGGSILLGADEGSFNKSTQELFVGPFIKWFPMGSPAGLRFDGGYQYAKESFSASTTTTTGLGFRAGIIAYF